MGKFSEQLKSMGKLILMMFAVTALLLFLLAFLVQQFDWQSGMINVGISAAYVISCFFGGFFAGKIQKSRKFLWGILLGFAYVLAMLLITLLVKHGFHSTAADFMASLFMCVVAGMLGGMIS